MPNGEHAVAEDHQIEELALPALTPTEIQAQNSADNLKLEPDSQNYTRQVKAELEGFEAYYSSLRVRKNAQTSPELNKKYARILRAQVRLQCPEAEAGSTVFSDFSLTYEGLN